jgi:hypothetical protein
VDTDTFTVEDPNILLNKGAGSAPADDVSGISIERGATGADGSMVWNETNNRFSMGLVGSETDIADISSAQTLTNKIISASSNSISGLLHGSHVDNPSSGVHGVTGNVVGTSDTQTLTSKTLGDVDVTTKLEFWANATIKLNDADNSDYVTLSVPSSLTNTYTLVMPAAKPVSPNQVLAFNDIGSNTFEGSFTSAVVSALAEEHVRIGNGAGIGDQIDTSVATGVGDILANVTTGLTIKASAIDSTTLFATGASASNTLIGIVNLSAQSFGGRKTFDDSLSIGDTSKDHTYDILVSELAANRNITLPALTANDTFVFESHSQTLSAKTLSGPTLSGTMLGSGTIGGSNLLGSTIGTGGNHLHSTTHTNMSNGDQVGYTALGTGNGKSRTGRIGDYYNSGSTSNSPVGYALLQTGDDVSNYLWFSDDDRLMHSTTAGNVGTATGTELVGVTTTDAMTNKTITFTGGGDVLEHYEEEALSDSWEGCDGGNENFTGHVTRVGNVVTVHIDASPGSIDKAGAGSPTATNALSANFRPAATVSGQIIIFHQGAYSHGTCTVSSAGSFELLTGPGSGSMADNDTWRFFRAQSFSYIVD